MAVKFEQKKQKKRLRSSLHCNWYDQHSRSYIENIITFGRITLIGWYLIQIEFPGQANKTPGPANKLLALSFVCEGIRQPGSKFFATSRKSREEDDGTVGSKRDPCPNILSNIPSVNNQWRLEVDICTCDEGNRRVLWRGKVPGCLSCAPHR